MSMKINDLPKIDRPREKLEKTIEQFENRNIRTGDGSTFLFTILKPFIYKGFRPPSGMP